MVGMIRLFPVWLLMAVWAHPLLAVAEPVSSPVAMDLILVLDNSGSMKRHDPGRLTKKAAATFIHNLLPGTRVSLLLFDGQVRVAMPFLPVSERLSERVRPSLSRLVFDGLHTNTPAAMERAIYMHKMHGRSEASKVIVLMSDGVVDTGNADRDRVKARWLREDLAAEAAAEGIRIYGIAFSERGDYQLMQTLALKTGGAYFRAFAAEDVWAVFNRIRDHLNRPAERKEQVETGGGAPVAPEAASLLEILQRALPGQRPVAPAPASVPVEPSGTVEPSPPEVLVDEPAPLPVTVNEIPLAVPVVTEPPEPPPVPEGRKPEEGPVLEPPPPAAVAPSPPAAMEPPLPPGTGEPSATAIDQQRQAPVDRSSAEAVAIAPAVTERAEPTEPLEQPPSPLPQTGERSPVTTDAGPAAAGGPVSGPVAPVEPATVDTVPAAEEGTGEEMAWLRRLVFGFLALALLWLLLYRPRKRSKSPGGDPGEPRYPWETVGGPETTLITRPDPQPSSVEPMPAAKATSLMKVVPETDFPSLRPKTELEADVPMKGPSVAEKKPTASHPPSLNRLFFEVAEQARSDLQPRAALRPVKEGSGGGTADIEITHRSTIIGRRAEFIPKECGCVVVDLPDISRNHALIEFQDRFFWLEDLDSANGSFKNGDRVQQRVRIKHGDRLRFCDAEFTFLLVEDADLSNETLARRAATQ